MRIFLIFFVVVLSFGVPLSEIIKDIEVSGEARYRFESNKKEEKQRVQIPTKNPENLK